MRREVVKEGVRDKEVYIRVAEHRLYKIRIYNKRTEALLADADRTYPTIAEQLKQLLESGGETGG